MFTPDADQPPPSFLPENTCAVDGCENPVAEWAGRGRRPTKCETHRGKSSGTVTPSRKTGNEKLAMQAATVLAQGNTLFAVVLRFGIPGVGKLPTSADMLTDDEIKSEFIEAAATALETDPGLCRLILRGGMQSAKWSLALAYLSMFGKVAPVMIAEAAMQREHARQEQEQREREG